MVCEGTRSLLLSLRRKSTVLVVLFVVLIMLGGIKLVCSEWSWKIWYVQRWKSLMVAVGNLQYPFMLNLCCRQPSSSHADEQGWPFCTSCSLAALYWFPHHYNGRKVCWVCVSCFSLIKDREDVEGMQRHFSLYFSVDWISDCATEFRSRPTWYYPLTGSLEYPG